MKFEELLAGTHDALTVRRVFGDPYEKDGVTFIPVASIRGGGGGGGGDHQERSGAGGGFGLTARPVGAYRIRGEEVGWIPAVDVTRVAVIGEAVAIVALLVLRSLLRRRRG